MRIPRQPLHRTLSDSHPLYFDSSSSSIHSTASSSSTISSNFYTPTSTVRRYGSTSVDLSKAKATLDALRASRPGYGTTSHAGSTVNFVNAMMGSGIIGLPLALSLCGFWTGLVCSIVIASLTCMALHMLVLTGIRTGQYSIVDLCRTCFFGNVGAKVATLVLLFHTAATAVSYFILIGDTLPPLLSRAFPDIPHINDRTPLIIAFGALVCLPLTLPRSMAPLAKWSALGVMLLPIVIIGVLIRMPAYAPEKLSFSWLNPSPEQAFRGIAILSLSFGCSQNVFGIYLSHRDQRPSQFLLANQSAVFLSFLINMTFAVLGYMCFGDDVQPNALLNFPQDDTVINLVRVALSMFMVMTIPPCMYPCREAFQGLLNMTKHGRIPSDVEHYSSTLIVYAVVIYYGATIQQLGKVFTVLGGFSTTAIGLMLPATAYLVTFLPGLIKAANEDPTYEESDSARTFVPPPSVETCCPLQLLEMRQEEEEVVGSWNLIAVATTLVFISCPIMYFSIADAFA